MEEKIKKEKRTAIYTENYRKGLYMKEPDVLCSWIKQHGVTLEVKSAGRNNDNTEFLVLNINGFKP